MGWFDSILYPIMWVVAWLMVGFHSVLTTLGLDPAGGAAWALSIVGLVIVMRILLIPLFVKQIKASRGMQLVAPEMQKIQKKYKGRTDPASREAMTRETMELYRKHGTNPFASCLPILAQSPIFFALFRVLFNLSTLANGEYRTDSIGPLTQDLAAQANSATIFGAPISSFFLQEGATAATRIVTVVLIVAMSATTFLTQKQLTQKNMPASAMQGPMAQQQKMLLYLLPLIFAITGVNFPIGVLIYWTTTNLWSMGQQFYVIRRNPTPGSEAERLLKERRARKAAAKGIVLEEEEPEEPEKPRGQRQQPKRKDRARPPAQGTRPASAGGAKPNAPKPTSQQARSGGSRPDRPSTGGTGKGAPGPKAGKPGATGKADGAGKANPQAGKPGGGKPAATKGPGKPKQPGSGGKPRPSDKGRPDGRRPGTPRPGAGPDAGDKS